MSFFSKLVMVGIVGGAGCYFYDLNTAKKQLKKASVIALETEDRCRTSHEGMCKYYATVLLKRENLQYRFQIPVQYYHIEATKLHLDDKIPVILKTKKIFPERILDIGPKYKAAIAKLLSEDKL